VYQIIKTINNWLRILTTKYYPIFKVNQSELYLEPVPTPIEMTDRELKLRIDELGKENRKLKSRLESLSSDYNSLLNGKIFFPLIDDLQLNMKSMNTHVDEYSNYYYGEVVIMYCTNSIKTVDEFKNYLFVKTHDYNLNRDITEVYPLDKINRKFLV